VSLKVDLSKDDIDRINGSEFYAHAKKIMKSFEEYAHVNVGEVYSIAYSNSSNKLVYVGIGKSRDKYMVINKDNGFIFAKRIKSDGQLGKSVVCLTIRFPQPQYLIELDSAQAESIIFDTEDSYDPFKDGKDLSRKKSKARRLNKSKVIKHNTEEEALAFVSSLKIGDTLYDAATTFGEGIVCWTVSSIEKRDVDKTPQKDWNGKVYAYGKSSFDQHHNMFNLSSFVRVTLQIKGELPPSRRSLGKSRDVDFVDFLDTKSRYRDWYLTKPASIEDV
jgi:hypothetical protein